MADTFEADRQAQLRDKAYRVASMLPSEEGYDPARSAKARDILGRMAKEHPVTPDTRETDFVDRVEGDPGSRKAVLLDRSGAPREVSAGNMREGQTVRRAPQNTNFGGGSDLEPSGVVPSPLPKGAVDIGDPLYYHRPAGDRTLVHIPGGPSIPDAVRRPVQAMVNGYTGGAADQTADRMGSDSPEARERFRTEHPYQNMAATAAGAVGSLSPGSLLSRGTAALSNGVNAGLSELAAASPRVAAILGMRGAPVAVRAAGTVLGPMAKGAGEASAVGAAQGAINGSPGGPREMIRQASGAAADPLNLALGAGFGATSVAARGVKNLLRDPNIALLERYGMEPGMLKPVINESDVVGTKSATGVDDAGPASRQAAGLSAAEAIVPDLRAREVANGRELGAQRTMNERNGVAAEPQKLGPLMNEIQAMRARPGVLPTTRGKLDTIANELDTFATKPGKRLAPLTPKGPEPSTEIKDALRGMQAMHDRLPEGPARDRVAAHIEDLKMQAFRTPGQSAFDEVTNPGTSAGATKVERPPTVSTERTIPAGSVQKISGMSYDLARPEASGGPDYPELFSLGQKLKQTLPEPMRAQDRAFARAQTGIESAQDTLGTERKPDENLRGRVPRETIEKAGQNIAAASEDTKMGAKATRRIADLREQGPPETMRGPKTARWPQGKPARGTPEQIDYGSQLDRPAIQTAQESLQLNPSAMFSGGWTGLPKKMVGVPAKRFIYPVAKGMSQNPASRPANVIHDIVGAVRSRQKREEDQ